MLVLSGSMGEAKGLDQDGERTEGGRMGSSGDPQGNTGLAGKEDLGAREG